MRKAVDAGEFSTALEHYIKLGFSEFRKPFWIDTWFYTHEYEFAAREISEGLFADHWQHYVEVGHKRGYRIHAPAGYCDQP